MSRGQDSGFGKRQSCRDGTRSPSSPPAQRLLDAAKGLTFGAYPAHGSGFVCIVEGDLDEFRDAIAEADQTSASTTQDEQYRPSQSQPCGMEEEPLPPVSEPSAQWKLDRLMGYLASAWLHGGWKAETTSERHMQAMLEDAGWWPVMNERDLMDRLDARLPS